MLKLLESGVYNLIVRLQETPTLILFDQDNESISTLEDDYKDEIAKWDSYLQKKQKTTIRTRHVTSQTTPRFAVDKTTQKLPGEFKNSFALVTLSDIHDEFQRMNSKGGDTPVEKKKVTQARVVKITMDKYFGDIEPNHPGKEEFRGISSEPLMCSLGCMERLLSSIENMPLIDVFTRGRDLLASRHRVSISHSKAKTEELWVFEPEGSRKMRVNCVNFVSHSPWLIVCGCGGINFGDRGALVGWNVKRITQPEIWIETPSSVTAVCTCPHAPQFCAVALLDGSLRVYELDTFDHSILLETSGSSAKHFAPVWWIEWRESQVISKSSTKGDVAGATFKKFVSSLKGVQGPQVSVAQVLVSASEDGTVKEWLFTKEDGLLACCTLLRIHLPTWLSLEIASRSGFLSEPPASPPRDEQESPPHTSSFRVHPAARSSRSHKPPTSLSTPERKSSPLNEGKPQTMDKEWKKKKRKQMKEKGANISQCRHKGTEKVLGFDEFSSFKLVPATGISFRPGSKTDYLLGTVAGEVLLCRTFDRDRVKQVFRGHTGQVSQVSWRPTGEDPTNIFLSSSLDETIRIWHVNRVDSPLCILKLPQGVKGGGYLDTKWCPWYGNLVASVHSDGIHLWDISLSSHSPVLSHDIPRATCTSFAPHTRNILVGDSRGSVHMIHVEGLKESPSLFYKYASGLSKLAKLSVSEPW